MNRRNPLFFPALFAFVSLLLTANPSVCQVGLHKNITPEAQQMAKEHLQSPMAKYLSGTGRNALNLMAGTLGQPATDRGLEAGPLPRLRPRPLAPLILQGPEVTVNDPSQDTFFETFFDISTQSETAVAGYDDGIMSNLVVTFNDSTDFATGNSLMGYARSTDGGASFTDLGAIPATPTGLNLGDPGIGVNRAGVFYASAIAFDGARPAGFRYAIGISKSMNGGQTFGTPVYPAPGGPVNSFTDKPALAVDASSGPGGGKNVYVTWTNFPFTGQLPIFFSRSIDSGATFSAPMQISSPGTINQGSALSVAPDGALYISWEEFSPFLGQPSHIVFTKSINGGMSFSTPAQVATLNDIGFFGGTMLPGFRVNSFPRSAVSPTTGTLVITYAANQFTGDSGDVFYIASPNGGATWSGPTQLNDDGTSTDQFFPVVAANSSGIFEFIWNDKRNDPANLSFDMFETQSLDDGASAQPNTQITSASSFPAFGYDPFIVPDYMGDYNDIEAIMTPSGPGPAFLQAWGDNRRVTVTRGGTRNDQDVMFHSD